MDGRPLLGGGHRIDNPDGTYGVFFEEAPEADLIRRWQSQNFTQTEHEASVKWKRGLEAVDLHPIKAGLSDAKKQRSDIKTDEDLFFFVQEYVRNPLEAYRVLRICLDLFGILPRDQKRIIDL